MRISLSCHCWRRQLKPQKYQHSYNFSPWFPTYHSKVLISTALTIPNSSLVPQLWHKHMIFAIATALLTLLDIYIGKEELAMIKTKILKWKQLNIKEDSNRNLAREIMLNMQKFKMFSKKISNISLQANKVQRQLLVLWII